MKLAVVDISPEQIRTFCEQNRIRKMALFGSVLRPDFTSDSDIDVLAEFLPGEPVGLIRLGTVEAELSDLLGRRVDLCMPSMLSKHFRDEVLASAETIYDVT